MRLFKSLAFAAAISLAAVGVGHAKGGGHGGSHAAKSASEKSTATTGDHVVHSYVKKDGTVVQSYHATNPNGTRNDNYSTRGNVNPYTGEPGSKPRDGEGPK
jgi:hypothetical protein